MVIKNKGCIFALSNNNDGAFSSNIKEIEMTTTIYNGLEYSTKSINRNFRIKVNGIVDGNKINKLVGVKGLIELIGVEMANIMTQCERLLSLQKFAENVPKFAETILIQSTIFLDIKKFVNIWILL